MRALIIDDEPHARARVRMFLREHDDVEVISEYGSGAEARDAIAAVRPDVVFLDVEMPELSGIDLARGLSDARASAGSTPRASSVSTARRSSTSITSSSWNATTKARTRCVSIATRR